MTATRAALPTPSCACRRRTSAMPSFATSPPCRRAGPGAAGPLLVVLPLVG